MTHSEKLRREELLTHREQLEEQMAELANQVVKYDGEAKDIAIDAFRAASNRLKAINHKLGE